MIENWPDTPQVDVTKMKTYHCMICDRDIQERLESQREHVARHFFNTPDGDFLNTDFSSGRGYIYE